MIKELRIGNLVYLNGELYEVESGSFSEDNIADVSVLEFVKPIPLTEEWKEKIKDNEELLIDASGFVIFKNGYAYQFVFEDYPFVHKIQNLFQILTNKELEFKKQPE